MGWCDQRVTRSASKDDGSLQLRAESELNFMASWQDLGGRRSDRNHVSCGSRAASGMVLHTPGQGTGAWKGSVKPLSRKERGGQCTRRSTFSPVRRSPKTWAEPQRPEENCPVCRTRRGQTMAFLNQQRGESDHGRIAEKSRKGEKSRGPQNSIHILYGTFIYGIYVYEGFPGGSEGKVSACSVADPGSTPGLGRSPGEGNGSPLQYFCLGNPMDGGAW